MTIEVKPLALIQVHELLLSVPHAPKLAFECLIYINLHNQIGGV